jgi:hypothetical protein
MISCTSGGCALALAVARIHSRAFIPAHTLAPRTAVAGVRGLGMRPQVVDFKPEKLLAFNHKLQ